MLLLLLLLLAMCLGERKGVHVLRCRRRALHVHGLATTKHHRRRAVGHHNHHQPWHAVRPRCHRVPII